MPNNYELPEQVEAADHLLEGEANLPGDELLLVGEDDGVAHLLPFRVPLNLRQRLRAYTVIQKE